MDNGTLSASDVALLSNNNGWDGFGGGGAFMWIFALLILAGGGFNGGWGNNNFANAIGYENLATQAQVDRGFDTQNMMANQRETLAAVNTQGQAAIAATNQAFHDNLNVIQDKYGELQRDIAGLAVGQANALANQNQCCCDTRLEIQQAAANTNAQIAQNRYDAAMNTAAINENTTAQTQKILDAISQNKIEALQQQVNALELQNAVAGVVRYPMSTVYSVPSPCFNTCFGGGNI